MSKRGMRKSVGWGMEIAGLAGCGLVTLWVFITQAYGKLFGIVVLILLLASAARIGWVAWQQKFWTTARMRRREGKCMRCGYDIKGEFERGCPECGWRRKLTES